MKKLSVTLILIAITVLLVMVGTASAGPFFQGSGAVNFTVQNKDAVNEANVIVQYIDTSGNVAATLEETIPAFSSAGFPIDTSGLPDGFEGSVIISSDTDIAAFAQMRWDGGQFGDGRTAGAYNGFSQGANTLYFPSIKARSNQFSILTIQSAEAASSTETITYDIAFYDRDGNLVEELLGETVNKGAQQSYDLVDDVDLPDDLNGSAVVTSSSPIAGVVTTHWETYATAYSGVSGGGTTAYIPEARRRLNSGVWDQYAGIVVQNLDAAEAADVTVTWFDRSGNELHSFDTSIPANSSKGFNTRFGADIPDYNALAADLGNAWNGSVVVESTNGKEIVAVTNLQWTATSSVGDAATSFLSEAAGGEQVLIPATFRRVAGGVWNQFTGLIVQNVGSGTCTDFGVEWYDRDGNKLLDYTGTLESGISAGYNTRFGSSGSDFPVTVDVTDLGDDFRGSVVISAPGCELIAIHNTLWPSWSDSTSYQGVID